MLLWKHIIYIPFEIPFIQSLTKVQKLFQFLRNKFSLLLDLCLKFQFKGVNNFYKNTETPTQLIRLDINQIKNFHLEITKLGLKSPQKKKN